MANGGELFKEAFDCVTGLQMVEESVNLDPRASKARRAMHHIWVDGYDGFHVSGFYLSVVIISSNYWLRFNGVTCSIQFLNPHAPSP